MSNKYVLKAKIRPQVLAYYPDNGGYAGFYLNNTFEEDNYLGETPNEVLQALEEKQILPLFNPRILNPFLKEHAKNFELLVK